MTLLWLLIRNKFTFVPNNMTFLSRKYLSQRNQVPFPIFWAVVADCEGGGTPKSVYKDQQTTDAFSISLLSHYATRYLKATWFF
jgi:hypothetical protein